MQILFSLEIFVFLLCYSEFIASTFSLYQDVAKYGFQQLQIGSLSAAITFFFLFLSDKFFNLKIPFALSLQQKQDESLLEDLWILLRAGRLEEACNLCRSAGQVRNKAHENREDIITY